jgi:hypothetical protein
MRAGPDLVTVLVTHDSFALSLAKASLESASIPYLIATENPDYLLPGILGGSGIGTTPLWNSIAEIRVECQFEAEARSLLEPLDAHVTGTPVQVDE